MTKKFDPREMVGERIIQMVEAGCALPWTKPWNSSSGLPRNAASGSEYRGGNLMLFSMLPYIHPLYLTYKQMSEHGGKLKESEKKAHFPVVMYKPFSVEDDNGDKKTIPIFRYYNVWNVDQIEANPEAGKKWDEFYARVTAPAAPKPVVEPIKEAESVISGYKDAPTIKFGGNRACYIPSIDEIHMPKIEDFKSAEHYYITFMHELTHSSGSPKRLNRKNVTDASMQGNHAYAYEELVAEVGACMLSSHCGFLDTSGLIENSVAYVTSWLAALKKDPKMLYKAASEAGRAADHILGIVRTYEKKEEAA